jgi:hypothetical protein
MRRHARRSHRQREFGPKVSPDAPSPAFCPLSPGLRRPGLFISNSGAAPLQLPHSVREHLECRKSLVSKAPVCKGYGPPRSKLLLDCRNRIFVKGSRSPLLGDAVLRRLNNVNAADETRTHSLRQADHIRYRRGGLNDSRRHDNRRPLQRDNGARRNARPC